MNDSKLIKYLLQETDEMENREIQQWIDADLNHQKQYERIRMIWEKSLLPSASKQIDVEKAWLDFTSRKNRKRPFLTKQLFLKPWLGIAASVGLAFIASCVIYILFMSPDNKLISNLNLETTNKSLSHTVFDGSIITLNKDTKLSFNQSLINTNRKVNLYDGEAFFQVERNEHRPFEVNIGAAKVTVLGTSFNIKKQEEEIEVILKSGAVKVDYKGKVYKMKPGDKLFIDLTKGLLTMSPVKDQLYNYYVGDYFEAKETPLWRIVEILNQAYDANIIIANERLRNLPLTTTFSNNSLENNLEVLKATFGLQILREPNRILIK
ncbi:FecR domain-containing protein [Echinicola marina]|uniref:FecR family protein n=1 Tax=Echinicola marina TaxID=2859768 RepID=UPI001CF63480|nr:FecR domain-containing protein [Echinicola marina]UCS92377.1 FecR domain-containing protein [Echinicola marina]